MGYRLSGFSTPIGGVSWDKSIIEKERIEYLFFYLQSKILPPKNKCFFILKM